MDFELGKVYSGYEFLEVASVASKDLLAYRVRNTFVRRQELLYILPAQSDPQQVDRFMREMRVRAALLHPNIVTLFNAGEIEGHLIMTTELVEGATLASRLVEGPLAWKEAVALVRQALSALTCAHAIGVVHRDISPANILITAGGVLKLSNFGLAKTADSPQLTKAGVIIGNLRYIPPEQVRGVGELDARSDIYSLGAVLYEMLCGRPPFDCKSEFELMLAHVNTPPVPVAEMNPDVPAALSAVVMKALAKEPAARFQNAAEFDRAVEEAAVPPVVVEAPAPAVEVAPEAPPAPPVVEAMVEAEAPVAAVEPEIAVAAVSVAVPPPLPELLALPELPPLPEQQVSAGPPPLPELPLLHELPPLPDSQPVAEPALAAEFDQTAELPRVIPFPVPSETPEPSAAEPEPLFASKPKGLRVQWALVGGTAAGIVAGVLAIWLAAGK